MLLATIESAHAAWHFHVTVTPGFCGGRTTLHNDKKLDKSKVNKKTRCCDCFVSANDGQDRPIQATEAARPAESDGFEPIQLRETYQAYNYADKSSDLFPAVTLTAAVHIGSIAEQRMRKTPA